VQYGKIIHYGIRTDQYKLIHFYDVVDTWEFFDLETDPYEMNNLYHDSAYTQDIMELKDQLIELQSEYKIQQ
jgi:arylsulfatase A-like enzyme